MSKACARDIIWLLSNVTLYMSATVKKNMYDISEELMRLDVGNRKFRTHGRDNIIFSYIFR
jgi:hypothetical protein